jgi:hypothetical protein
MSPNHPPSNTEEPRGGIGTLNEFSLHAGLIKALSQAGDLLEADVGGFLADILRDTDIIEVQTRNLSSLKKKIAAFAPEHRMTIVHPVTQNKWIVRKNADGEIVSRRRSPKHGRIEEIFTELVRAWDLIDSPNVSLEIVFIDADEVWLDDGQGSWRRKYWSISERHLLKIHRSETFHHPRDFLILLPESLPAQFTNKQLAAQLGIRARLAGKITYTLRKMEVIQIVGKTGNQNIFQIIKDNKDHA